MDGSGGKCVNGNDKVRLDLVGDRLNQFSALHAGRAQHTCSQCGDRPKRSELLRGLGNQMAGHHGLVHRSGTDCIRSDQTVAEAHHQCGCVALSPAGQKGG